MRFNHKHIRYELPGNTWTANNFDIPESQIQQVLVNVTAIDSTWMKYNASQHPMIVLRARQQMQQAIKRYTIDTKLVDKRRCHCVQLEDTFYCSTKIHLSFHVDEKYMYGGKYNVTSSCSRRDMYVGSNSKTKPSFATASPISLSTKTPVSKIVKINVFCIKATCINLNRWIHTNIHILHSQMHEI